MTSSPGGSSLPRTQRTQGPLTQPEAQDQLGCLRLGARIWDLKQRGHAIRTEFVELASGQRVARYSLVRTAPSEAAPTPDAGRSIPDGPPRQAVA